MDDADLTAVNTDAVLAEAEKSIKEEEEGEATPEVTIDPSNELPAPAEASELELPAGEEPKELAAPAEKAEKPAKPKRTRKKKEE